MRLRPTQFLAICLVMLAASHCHGQSGGNAPTRGETEQWITDKIVAYTWSDREVQHTYSVSFKTAPLALGFVDSRIMMITHEQFTGNVYGNGRYVSSIHIKDIENVSFQRKPHNTWMVLKLKDELEPWTIINNDLDPSQRIVSFILNDRINDDDLPNRMKKAFSALVGMCGGTSFNTKEAY